MPSGLLLREQTDWAKHIEARPGSASRARGRIPWHFGQLLFACGILECSRKTRAFHPGPHRDRMEGHDVSRFLLYIPIS